MKGRATVVLDIGKTHSRVSLWVPGGRLLDRRRRENHRIGTRIGAALDAAGIEAWLAHTLQELAPAADIGAIIPVAHGAAAAVIREGTLLNPPLDYEQPIPAAIRHEYDAQRDPFSLTGSPSLPDGLNLGAQLHYLEALERELLPRDATLLTWPQYWSWLLSGEASSEVTSLACHTDLWCPWQSTTSPLADSRGWASQIAPVRGAGEILGALTAQWAARTTLKRDVEIHCGLHDSNAALLASRAFEELAGHDATVLSTGTWFIAMRTPRELTLSAMASLPEARDCLVNVDAFGKPAPSARFMGGREIDLLTGSDTRRIDVRPDQDAILQAIPRVLTSDAMVLPSLVRGCGPFGEARGEWVARPAVEDERRAAISLYAALVTDVSLDLIGARDRLLIEGRFAGATGFARALATLRPETAVYAADVHNDVSFGALSLVDAQLPAPAPLTRVMPLDLDLTDYRRRWQERTRARSQKDERC